MIKNKEDEIYNRIKDNIGFEKSKKFKKWFHAEYPGKQQHHGCGSYTGIKTSDYFSIPVTAEEHAQAEKDKSKFCIDNIHVFILVMKNYIKFLERNNDSK